MTKVIRSKLSRLLSIFLLLVLVVAGFAFIPAVSAKTAATASSTSTQPQVQEPPWLLSLLEQHHSEVSTGSSPTRGATPMYIKLNDSQTTSNSIEYSPSEIRNIYDATPLLKAGYNGAGETIAIVDAYGDPYIQSELNTFSSEFGIPTTTVHIVCVDGPCDFAEGITTGWNAEIALDVEWSHAMAPGATINLYIGSNNAQPLYDAVAAAVAGTNGNGTYVSPSSIISMSWGEPENDFGESGSIAPVFGENYPWLNDVFQQGIAQGITFFASTGDWGAYDQSFGQTSPYGGAIYPSTDPFVTAVGGTSLYMATTGGYIQYPYANAKGGYGYETAWSWNNYRGWGTGGGFSTFFSQPYWQTGPGVPSGATRGAPDVSWDADPLTGVLVFVNGGFYIYGGTSVGSPSWAGSMALIDQYAGHNLGFINPSLYSIFNNPAEYAKAFHDITIGNNNPNQAGPGWNPLTGIGTPDIAMLAHYLAIPSTSLSVSASNSVALGTSASYTSVQIFATVMKGTTPVTTGTMSAQITSATGTTIGTVPMTYNSTSLEWTGTYSIKPTDPPGMWTATVSITSGSQKGTGSTTFSVGDGITIFESWGFFLVGNQIPIQVVVTSPDGQLVTSGSFTATFTYLGAPGKPIQGKLPLKYNPADEAWEGTFTIGLSARQGPWEISIAGSDTNGNLAAVAYSWVNVGLVATTFTDSPTYLLGQPIVIYSTICPIACSTSTVTTGSFKATVYAFGPTDPDGSYIGVVHLTYNSTLGLWWGFFFTSSHDPTGFYEIAVTGGDGFGNSAYGETVVREAPLNLNVVATLSRPTVVVGSPITDLLSAAVTYPNGTSLKVGSVEAFTTYGHVRLTYHSSTNSFVGILPLPSTAGSYPIVISAYDPIGNMGGAYVGLTVVQSYSTTKVSCTGPIKVGGVSTCTATVSGYSPTGNVTWSQSGTGSVTFSSLWCTLVSGTCYVTATGITAGQLTVTGTYTGDANNLGSFGNTKLTVTKT